jgi:hypothetical protein
MQVAIVKSSEITAEKGLNANKYVPPTKEEIKDAYVMGWKSGFCAFKGVPERMTWAHDRVLQAYLSGRDHALRELKKLEKKMKANAEWAAEGWDDVTR